MGDIEMDMNMIKSEEYQDTDLSWIMMVSLRFDLGWIMVTASGDEHVSKMVEWVDDHAQSKVHNRNRHFIFESEKDATMFLLKWNSHIIA